MGEIDNRINLSLGFLRTAYSDYIAARVLLNKGYTLQGMILASTAIEKYFKTGICIKTGIISKVHMDRFDMIKGETERIGYGILFEKIDPKFFELLSKAYTLRYYDNIKAPMTIGCMKNQFLGELDGAVELFERLLIIQRGENKEVVLSPLKRDFKVKNPDLFENNWVTTTEKNKKQFMETDCEVFTVHIFPENLFEEIQLVSGKFNIPYKGTMTLISITSQDNKE